MFVSENCNPQTLDLIKTRVEPFGLELLVGNTKDFIKKITENALKNGIPKGVVLNVNIPSVEKSKIKGVKVCRQANASWVEEFDKRKNPLGQEYYWLTGKFVNKDKGEDTDEWALNQNYISIVPVEFDLTAHHAIQELNEWNFQ